MITHKSKFAPFPLTVKITLKRNNWYLFPQGWSWVGGFSEVSYQASDGTYDIWEETHYQVPKGYAFSWLLLHIVFEVRKNKGNTILYEKREVRMPDISKESNSIF